jgi:hypothetical protein
MFGWLLLLFGLIAPPTMTNGSVYGVGVSTNVWLIVTYSYYVDANDVRLIATFCIACFRNVSRLIATLGIALFPNRTAPLTKSMFQRMLG